MKKLRVLFAPDYRAGNPYQAYLAEALAEMDIEVSFLSEYRRVLPLMRGSRSKPVDIIHIHWPEKYFGQSGGWWNRLRQTRYPFDLWLTAARVPIVWTAHNLMPHNRGSERVVLKNMRQTAKRSGAIFVHSEEARNQLAAQLSVPLERIHVIPFGDHSIGMQYPVKRQEARLKLRLPLHDKLCLVFGTVSPYKGTDDLLCLWRRRQLPCRLVVIGPVLSPSFADMLRNLADGCSTIDLRLTPHWVDDDTLRMWLSAADCALFNYREIFSSGAAALARSFGVPVILPRRLTTVDLNEPDPLVFRFDTLDTDFLQTLDAALTTAPDYDRAKEWRDATSWERVAKITSQVYSSVLTACDVIDEHRLF